MVIGVRQFGFEVPKHIFLEKMNGYIKDADNGCIVWTGKLNWLGYGRLEKTINFKKKQLSVHRVSYEIYKGEIPPKMLVCHTCDNRACLNPDHLFLGTHADNRRDMVSKGRDRILKGSETKGAKLTETKIIEILNSNLPYKQIAVQYGVSASTISLIKTRKRWKHVKI